MNITLISSDGVSFAVEPRVAQQSILIRNMIEDIHEENFEVPIPNVTSNVLKKVLEYCEHHKNDELITHDEDVEKLRRNIDIDEWDQKFLHVDQELLFELILAANYLDIKPMLETSCKAVANMIRGKTPEEIRRTFNITNDFTPEEEAQIKCENEWAEDR